MGRWTIKLELGGAPGDHRVHGSVHRLDPVDVRRDHFARRDLTAAHHPRQRDRVFLPQGGHQRSVTGRRPARSHPASDSPTVRVTADVPKTPGRDYPETVSFGSSSDLK